MVGLIQILIYLFVVYLGYKSVEIFMIAFVSRPRDKRVRYAGLVIAALGIVGAIVVAFATNWVTETHIEQMQKQQQEIPRFP